MRTFSMSLVFTVLWPKTNSGDGDHFDDQDNNHDDGGVGDDDDDDDDDDDGNDIHLHHISGLHTAVAEHNCIWSSGDRKSKGIGTHNA